MSIEVLNESGEGDVNEEMLIDVSSYALAAMDVHPETEVTVTLVDEATMADLHVRWMDLEGPTDVMSFPMDELTPGGGRPDAAQPGPSMLGDIILCPAFDRRQAEVAGHDLGHELALLTVHGVLHLLGYDHVAPEDEREMFSLQNEILADWYDSLARRGVEYQPKPTGAQAFPSAADRDELDRRMKDS
ncbi:rRNA maturation RNase YbeY [Corynebacterium qintianiae]|uniref:Endoribonuclease YbeY n=1 Tax=Corynebacterium qintianiae TaxID=2709392 RepID=A0A7T0KL69_9CORY|nr:rRNA maturation RNase YbeY [Corynebacterium qintianiae]QPK82806.1 rRNA maturation RNase YbeY [Corynebacterium qintianiae]